MQRSVASAITLAAIVVKAIQERRKLVKEFQSRDVGLFDLLLLLSPFGCHAANYARYWHRAQL